MQVSKLRLYGSQMALCESAYLRAGVRVLGGEAQKIPNFIYRETQIAAAANEPKPVHMLLAIGAVVPFGAGGSGEDFGLLVVPNCDHFDARLSGELSDAEMFAHAS